jgi:DNA polymerase/3'-5' exonuclease PolX
LSNSVTNDDGYAWPRGEIYSNAADKISKLDYPVTSGCELAFGPKKIYGIGKGVARLIDEYLNAGTMTQSEHLE